MTETEQPPELPETNLPDALPIDDLLAHGVQPFKPLDRVTLDALKRGIDPGQVLMVNVVVTPYGKLLNGHQRLQVLREQGRKAVYRSKGEYKIDTRATPDNELMIAVGYQMNQRNMSARDKADAAIQLMETHGWNQSEVAEAFNVSRAAVSQWLKARDMGGTTHDIKKDRAAAANDDGAGYAGSAAEALKTLQDELTTGLRPAQQRALRAIRVDRASAYPAGWAVTVPTGRAHEAEDIRQRLEEHADDIRMLAKKIKDANAWKP